MTTPALPRYDRGRSYEWNYQNAPDPERISTGDESPVPAVPGAWDYCGFPVDSPLGIAAGPLLNGQWVLYYASLGFDVLTYKTVRSVARASYDVPNLQPVRTVSPLTHAGETLPAEAEMRGSWAVSFGMPSRAPEVWRADIRATRAALPRGKVLSVSVVATPAPGWTLAQLANDYARCARWAVGAGADCVEANFSCPNVASCDGDLYQRPADAAAVAAAVRDAVGKTPLLVKLGHVDDPRLAAELVASLGPHVDGLVMVNTVRARVVGPGGVPVFDGQPRGVAGAAIRDAALAQARLFSNLAREAAPGMRIVGVGGIGSAEQVRRFLDAGCHGVQLATAAMLDPEAAFRIRREWTAGAPATT